MTLTDNWWPRVRALLLLLPLLPGCAHDSPIIQPAQIPPLPAQARQTDSPSFSASAQTDIQAWLQALTAPSSPAAPASAPTTR